jgi:hypothetical protein
MNMPGFTAELSVSTKRGSYRAQTSDLVSAMPAAAIWPSMTPQAAMRRIGLGISYPPPDDGGCQICDCTCYPFPC